MKKCQNVAMKKWYNIMRMAKEENKTRRWEMVWPGEAMLDDQLF